jgi:hypothetical protein
MVLLAMVGLIAAGLNISNEGVNQLTGEDRKAVIAVNAINEGISLELLGVEYQYPQLARDAAQWLEYCLYNAMRYVQKIWIIFDAVFLPD